MPHPCTTQPHRPITVDRGPLMSKPEKIKVYSAAQALEQAQALIARHTEQEDKK
jgi:hypothetical protein